MCGCLLGYNLQPHLTYQPCFVVGACFGTLLRYLSNHRQRHPSSLLEDLTYQDIAIFAYQLSIIRIRHTNREGDGYEWCKLHNLRTNDTRLPSEDTPPSTSYQPVHASSSHARFVAVAELEPHNLCTFALFGY
jgi:hypothetical protein